MRAEKGTAVGRPQRAFLSGTFCARFAVHPSGSAALVAIYWKQCE
ncbi:hypothetical protein [Streptomyces sp. NPDC047803]